MSEEGEVKEPAESLGDNQEEVTLEQAVQEQNTPPQSKKEERPEWLPEKYKTVDDFLEGHKNLEKKLGERDEIEPTSESESDQSEAEEQVGAAEPGPLDQFFEEYGDTGTISEESLVALEELGYPREMVDTYIKGYEAQVQQMKSSAYDMVGGEENYDAMVAWAVDNMDTAQLDAYNNQLAQGGDNWEIALRGLYAKYAASGEAPVQHIRSGEKNDASRGVQPFESQAEMAAAIRDKRYQTDSAYRAAVSKRLEVTDDATAGAMHTDKQYASRG